MTLLRISFMAVLLIGLTAAPLNRVTLDDLIQQLTTYTTEEGFYDEDTAQPTQTKI